MPDELYAPDILPGAAAWWEAFWELGTERQIGMAEGPIPANAIREAAHGLSRDEADGFRRVMRAMDAIYLAHRAGPKSVQRKHVSQQPVTPALVKAVFGKG